VYYPSVDKHMWRTAISRITELKKEHVVYVLLLLMPIFMVTVRHWLSTFFGLIVLYSMAYMFSNNSLVLKVSRESNILRWVVAFIFGLSIFLLPFLLLPLFSESIRPWIASLIGIIVLLAMIYYFRKESFVSSFAREEVILFWAFGLFFLVFILTAVVNGWEKEQTRYLGNEIRYLLFIPVYLAIRQVPDAQKWLLTGLVFGILATFWEEIVNPDAHYYGRFIAVYGPLFTGPVTGLMAAILLVQLKTIRNIWLGVAIVAAIFISIIPIVQTDARSAFFVFPVLILISVLYLGKGVQKVFIMSMTVIVLILLYSNVDKVNNRIGKAYTEYAQYFAYKNPAQEATILTSVGLRIEMWRVTPSLFMENPVLGVGRGNYQKSAKQYTESKRFHRDIASHSHPHNAYSEMLISKGVVGLFVFFGITLLPLVMLLRDYKKHAHSAISGIVLITGYLLFSLVDASTFIKGNYIALYIVFLSVFFSYHIREKRLTTE